VSNQQEAHAAIDAHGKSIDELHAKLAATPGTDQAKLEAATAKYKAAHKDFHDAALACMN
jgi:hypothetical protein